MSKQYHTRLNHLFGAGGFGIKLSPTYGDSSRAKFIREMGSDPKVESAFLKALDAVNGMCPKGENNISNDSPMGDLLYTLNNFSKAGDLQRGAVFALGNAIQASTTFRGLARAKHLSQAMKHKLGITKPVPFKEPLMIHGGETTIGQGSAYVPSEGGQRRQKEKQGNAKIVSNLSVEQGKGMLEPQNVHPDALMENQSLPKITSIRESMTDISSFQPTSAEKYSLNTKEAPGDLKRATLHQRLGDAFPEKVHAERGLKRKIPQGGESLSDKKMKGMDMLRQRQGTHITEAPVTQSLNVTAYPTGGLGTGGKTTMGGQPGVAVSERSPMVIENLNLQPHTIAGAQYQPIPFQPSYGTTSPEEEEVVGDMPPKSTKPVKDPWHLPFDDSMGEWMRSWKGFDKRWSEKYDPGNKRVNWIQNILNPFTWKTSKEEETLGPLLEQESEDMKAFHDAISKAKDIDAALMQRILIELQDAKQIVDDLAKIDPNVHKEALTKWEQLKQQVDSGEKWTKKKAHQFVNGLQGVVTIGTKALLGLKVGWDAIPHVARASAIVEQMGVDITSVDGQGLISRIQDMMKLAPHLFADYIKIRALIPKDKPNAFADLKNLTPDDITLKDSILAQPDGQRAWDNYVAIRTRGVPLTSNTRGFTASSNGGQTQRKMNLQGTHHPFNLGGTAGFDSAPIHRGHLRLPDGRVVWADEAAEEYSKSTPGYRQMKEDVNQNIQVGLTLAGAVVGGAIAGTLSGAGPLAGIIEGAAELETLEQGMNTARTRVSSAEIQIPYLADELEEASAEVEALDAEYNDMDQLLRENKYGMNDHEENALNRLQERLEAATARERQIRDDMAAVVLRKQTAEHTIAAGENRVAQIKHADSTRTGGVISSIGAGGAMRGSGGGGSSSTSLHDSANDPASQGQAAYPGGVDASVQQDEERYYAAYMNQYPESELNYMGWRRIKDQVLATHEDFKENDWEEVNRFVSLRDRSSSSRSKPGGFRGDPPAPVPAPAPVPGSTTLTPSSTTLMPSSTTLTPSSTTLTPSSTTLAPSSTQAPTTRPGMIPSSTTQTPTPEGTSAWDPLIRFSEWWNKPTTTPATTTSAPTTSPPGSTPTPTPAPGGTPTPTQPPQETNPSGLPYTGGSQTTLGPSPWMANSGGMRPMIPVNENLPNTEPTINLLRPMLAEGGANLVTNVLKNPTLQSINRLMWLSWNCGQWDSNQEPDNPLNMVGLVESAWRFSGELDMESLFEKQCSDAITEEYAKEVHTAYSIPEQVIKDGVPIIQDIIPQPIEPAPSSETDNLFHDVYLPCWADIPEDSPWNTFTAIEGNQIPDSMLHNPNRITGNDWPLLASENSWISTTLD